MLMLFRVLMTAVTAIATFYFVFWFGGALLLLGANAPLWLAQVAALAAAVAAGRFVWTRTATVRRGMTNAVVLGAVTTGGVGFAAGFFGPMIFMPESGQGPLLGIFLTGPLGVFLGALGGALYWTVWGEPRMPRHSRHS